MRARRFWMKPWSYHPRIWIQLEADSAPPRDQVITAGPWAEGPAKPGSADHAWGSMGLCPKRLDCRGRRRLQRGLGHRLGALGERGQESCFSLFPHAVETLHSEQCPPVRTWTERLACDKRLPYRLERERWTRAERHR